MPAGRTSLWTITLLCAVVFLGMTVDTLRKMPARTHSDQLSEQVVEGKRIWQHYDCNDCHTILGIGGYYAPDVTKSYPIRGEAWLRQFLKDPHAIYPSGRQMPNFRLTDPQITDLVAYLKWVGEVDTNGWPPAPQGVARQESEGHRIFLAEHCNSCHAIEGSGGVLAPELTHVGSRRDKPWILEQLDNPRAHKPDSIMPSFAQLPASEKEELAEYLANLK
ncbi:MAG TPA: c-type cytochrome [Terriglobia bacterium]|nr:c-type cytochrome [Terriglobia bacterium]